jgi:antitoxin component HigA of HigAB toxin-antitoxin module
MKENYCHFQLSDDEYSFVKGKLEQVLNTPAGQQDSTWRTEANLMVKLISWYEKSQFPSLAKVLYSTISEADHTQANPLDIIKNRMKELGINKTVLAQRVELSKPRITELLNARRKMSLALAKRIAAAIDVPLTSLLADYPIYERAYDKQRGDFSKTTSPVTE